MQQYDRLKAVEYAHKWWNKRNPLYYNFDLIGGDCTNFVSQCLIAGGFNMNYYDWYYSSLNYRSYSWTGVNEFYAFLVQNKDKNNPSGKQVDIAQIEIGDVVQLAINSEIFHHTAIVTKLIPPLSPETIFVTCHTNDAKDIPLSAYAYKKLKFIKIT